MPIISAKRLFRQRSFVFGTRRSASKHSLCPCSTNNPTDSDVDDSSACGSTISVDSEQSSLSELTTRYLTQSNGKPIPKNIDCSSRTGEQEKHVSFGTVDIRSYEVVVDYHPFCSSGCGISLGWKYETKSSQTLDNFEASRIRCRRSLSNLKTTWIERYDRLLQQQQQQVVGDAEVQEQDQQPQDSNTHHEIRQARRMQQRNRNRKIQRQSNTHFSNDDSNPSLLIRAF